MCAYIRRDEMSGDLTEEIHAAWDRFNSALEKCRNGDESKYAAILDEPQLPPKGSAARLQKVCELLIPALQSEMLTSALPSSLLPDFINREKEFLTTLNDLLLKVPRVVLPTELKITVEKFVVEQTKTVDVMLQQFQSLLTQQSQCIHAYEEDVNGLQNKSREIQTKITRKIQAFERRLHRRNSELLNKLPEKMRSSIANKDNYNYYLSLLNKSDKSAKKALHKFVKRLVGKKGLSGLFDRFSVEFKQRKKYLISYYDAEAKVEKLKHALEKQRKQPDDTNYPSEYSEDMRDEFSLFNEILQEYNEEKQLTEHLLQTTKRNIASIEKMASEFPALKNNLLSSLEKIRQFKVMIDTF